MDKAYTRRERSASFSALARRFRLRGAQRAWLLLALHEPLHQLSHRAVGGLSGPHRGPQANEQQAVDGSVEQRHLLASSAALGIFT